MKLILSDLNPEVVAAWRAQFADRHPEVEIQERSILEGAADALVNPGNSFGFMDGGLALKICERFGMGLEETIRTLIQKKHSGEMLVGQAEVISTGSVPPFLIYAPTMRTPQSVKGTVNAYLAAQAVFATLRAYNETSGGEPIRSLVIPGLCTGTGGMPPLISARQVRYAYEEALGLRKVPSQNLSRLTRREKKLKQMPQQGEEGD